MCHCSYLNPVKDLLVAGHVLQEESLQLLAQLLRRQDRFRQIRLGAGAVRQNELEFLFVSRRDNVDMMRKCQIKRMEGEKKRMVAFITNLLWDESLDVLFLWQEVRPVEARVPPQRTYSPMALYRQEGRMSTLSDTSRFSDKWGKTSYKSKVKYVLYLCPYSLTFKNHLTKIFLTM